MDLFIYCGGNVIGMILRGIFLMTRKELNWFYKDGGASLFWPEKWKEFVDIPAPSENMLFLFPPETLGMHCFFRKLFNKRSSNWSLVPHCPRGSPVVTFVVLPHFFFKAAIVKHTLQVLILCLKVILFLRSLHDKRFHAHRIFCFSIDLQSSR